MEIDLAGLEGALMILGQLLADRGLQYEIVAIGGGGLLLLGLIDRSTRDLDLVALMKDKKLISADPLPRPFIQAVADVAKTLNLRNDWLNIGPASLLEMGLPSGFARRLHIRKYKGLTIHLADRFDQICFKLYASVDQGPQSKHFIDLQLLKPSSDELQKAREWCVTQDNSSSFEIDLDQALRKVHGSN